MTTFREQFDDQQFSTDYKLVNGVAMHTENPENFHVPPDVIKRHFRPGQFVELSSAHEGIPEKCSFSTSNGEMTKPILKHDHLALLVPLPKQNVPSRGWGEEFWVKVEQRSGRFFHAIVDNPLVESRLHGLKQGDEIVFHEDHILSVHDIHRQELVEGMNVNDLKELVQWVGH